MRFLEAGPDIPQSLIAAQEKGATIFVCGAGVSIGAGLPTFRGLVERIYAHLHEDWSQHVAEREGMNEGGSLYGQYDRVLRSLERRLAASDIARNAGMRERIRAAVRASLAVPEGADLANHLALLELSRDEAGTTRIVTTNFDTLFERAWFHARGSPIATHAGMAMPQPRVAGFAGTLHVHGRLGDANQVLGATETDLVLTSAEFGDAYLRIGWASRYVYDLVRAHTVVLVGYQADDPPMRYLLEALEADRDRYPDLKPVFAFAPSPAGDEARQKALWRAKGVEPIVYSAAGHDHSGLYDSLREWRTYAADPTSWRREHLRAIFAGDSGIVAPADLARCCALLSHGDASILLGELSPDPAWLPVLADKQVFDKGDVHPGEWIAARINDAAMIRASAGLGGFSDAARWHINRALEFGKEDVSPVRRKAWRLMLAQRKRKSPRRDLEDNWYITAKRGLGGYDERTLIARMYRPRLIVAKLYRSLELDPNQPESLNDLVRVDFESTDHPSPEDVLADWPNTLADELGLLYSLDRALLDALEQAEDTGFLSGYDGASGDVPSIAPHGQNSYRTGFAPIVATIAGIWERVVINDGAKARDLADRWSRWPYLLMTRLWLFALESDVFTPQDVGRAVRDLPDQTFWIGDASVEIMRALVKRWGQLDADDRQAIEGRLRDGVPRALYREDAFEDNEDWLSVSDSTIFRRLKRIQASGGALSAQSVLSLEGIAARHPKWQPGPGDRDDFGHWMTVGSGPSGHPELLAGVADNRLVSEALRLQQEQQFAEGNVWRVFCSADPDRALRGLMAEAAEGRWDAASWRSLLNVASEKGDADFQIGVAAAMRGMPGAQLTEMLSVATSWLQRRRADLAIDNLSTHFFPVWDRFADLAYVGDGPLEDHDGGNDALSEALNRPGGVLAWALVEALGSLGPDEGAGLGGSFVPRFDRLVDAAGKPGLLARMMMVESIAYIHSIAPLWVVQHLVPFLGGNHPEALSLWKAFARGHIPKAALFNVLKAAMLANFQARQLDEHDFEGIVGDLLAISLWHHNGEGAEYDLTDAELKRALTVGPQSVRRNVAWNLWRIMGEANVEQKDRALRWQQIVGPLFAQIWPMDADLRDEQASRHLVLMALDSEAAFPEVVSAIKDFLIPYQLYEIAHSLRLNDRHSGLVALFPIAFLTLANAILDPASYPVPHDLPKLLDDCRAADGAVVNDPAYIRLAGLARQSNA